MWFVCLCVSPMHSEHVCVRLQEHHHELGLQTVPITGISRSFIFTATSPSFPLPSLWKPRVCSPSPTLVISRKLYKDFLVVQWLHPAFQCRGCGLGSPGWGTKIPRPTGQPNVFLLLIKTGFLLSMLLAAGPRCRTSFCLQLWDSLSRCGAWVSPLHWVLLWQSRGFRTCSTQAQEQRLVGSGAVLSSCGTWA